MNIHSAIVNLFQGESLRAEGMKQGSYLYVGDNELKLHVPGSGSEDGTEETISLTAEDFRDETWELMRFESCSD